MTEAPIIMWSGLSGKKYKYWIYPIGSSFKKEPGQLHLRQGNKTWILVTLLHWSDSKLR